MKKLLSLLLCLALVAGALLCLTACRGGTDPIDLTDYKLIYKSSYKNIFATWAKGFATTLSDYTGLKISSGIDASGAVGEKEILLGATNRPESTELLSKIEGEGYAYGVVNGKLVLVGTTDLMTVMAVEAFAGACLTGEGGALVTVEETVVSNAPTVEITGSYSVIYNQDWDASGDTGSGRLPSDAFEDDEEKFSNRDHGVIMAEQVRNLLKGAVTITSTSLSFTSDKKDPTKREVLVGLVNRDATKQFIKTIDADGFGVALYGQTLVVSGLNDNGLRQAVDMLEQLIKLGATTNESGKKILLLPAGFRMVATKNFGWELDVPRPEGEGIELAGSVDVGEGSVELYYTGHGVNAEAFNRYCGGMADKGYTLLQENTLEGSIFRLYRNDSKGILLYTAYADYKHAFTEGVTMYDKCIRVVTADVSKEGNQFSEDILTPQYDTYTKVTDTRLTAARLDYEGASLTVSRGGNLYIMQLEDGSFIVQDGGISVSGSVARIYQVLADLYRQAFGFSPSQTNPIVISAWYMSHGHGDHTGNFLALCRDYGKTIKLERLIANNPSDLESYNCLDPNLHVRNNLATIANYTQGKTQYLKVHTGMKLYLANVEIEVLYTHEDIYPVTFERFNNSSTVLRTVIHNTDGSGHVQGKDTSVLWLGDLQTRGSACLRAMFGDYMQSDMVQIAHHGGAGCERELYELTKASILLWPCSAKQMMERANDSGASRGTWAYVSYHTYHMDSVQYNIASDIYNTTVTVTKDGPNMTLGGKGGLYNAGESASVVISDKPAVGNAIVKMN
ncbi:MAG: hypothetical protein J6L87_02160 [Clostridia bacterium]|nr:hypothetical protein [Clostridia bacterium]